MNGNQHINYSETPKAEIDIPIPIFDELSGSPKVESGKIYINVDIDVYNNPVAIRMHAGTDGRWLCEHVEAYGALITLAIQAGMGIDVVYETLIGIKGNCNIGIPTNIGFVRSLPDAIGKALRDWHIQWVEKHGGGDVE